MGICRSGIIQAIGSLALELPDDLRIEIFSNIHLSGGGWIIPGFLSRFRSKLTKDYLQLPQSPNITAFRDGGYDPWIGGCIFSKGSNYFQNSVSAAEYWECGAPVITWKCFG
jgi:actin-related protein